MGIEGGSRTFLTGVLPPKPTPRAESRLIKLHAYCSSLLPALNRWALVPVWEPAIHVENLRRNVLGIVTSTVHAALASAASIVNRHCTV